MERTKLHHAVTAPQPDEHIDVKELIVVEAIEEMSHTESALLTSHPFFAGILFTKMSVVPTTSPEIPTAATDGETMWINVFFFEQLSPPERIFLYCHEICHAIMLHMARGKEYSDMGHGPDMKVWSHEKWNHACDYIINAMLTSDKIGTMPMCGLYHPNITGDDLADEVYIKIPEPPKKPGGGGGSGGGKGKMPGKGEGFDKHLSPDKPVTEAQKADMEVAVKQAAAAAKAQGKLPASLAKLIDGLLNPKIDWTHYLMQEISTAVARAISDYSRPNRRRLVGSHPIILPSYSGVCAGTIVITIDTSGSVSVEEAKMYLTEVKAICEEYTPEEIYILWVDAAVAHADYLDDVQEIEDIIERVLKQGMPGGGGTDMTETFDYIDKWGIEPHTCLIFTDGYTDFGEAQSYPVVWCVSCESQMKAVPKHFPSKVLVDIPH